MATDANKELLAGMGIEAPDVAAATPNDLIIAIMADNAATIERLLGEMDTRLTPTYSATSAPLYHSIEAACGAHPQSNLVVISVPGAYAAREARKALEQGKHVFLFSDNVPLEQEVELKQLARSRRLLVMGPGCGTSLIGGVGIGFANRVRPGPIGIVGASGTGIQEYSSLIHQAGSGISHAIGTGSRDLSDAVAGITTLMGFDILEDDPATQIIALISKPAGADTLHLLQGRLQRCRKPVIGCLLGLHSSIDGGPSFRQVRSVDEAVAATMSIVGNYSGGDIVQPAPTSVFPAEQEVRSWLPEQRYLRGLFSGGTLCFQAQQVLQDAGIPVYSNTPLDGRYRLNNPDVSLEHSIIDLGDDQFTQGKPHPMIDAGERRRRILREANDPEVAILLLDFVLGEMSSANPVGDLLDALHQAQHIAERQGGHLTIVASVCGTERDRQDKRQQQTMLVEAGAHVLPSSTTAAAFCRDLIRQAGVRQNG